MYESYSVIKEQKIKTLKIQITSCEVKRTIWKLLHDKKAFEKMLFKIIRLHKY